MRIEEVPGLNKFSHRLLHLGYSDVTGVANVFHACPDALVQYLDSSHRELADILNVVAAQQGTDKPVASPTLLPLGARLDGIVPPSVALMRPPGLSAALPTSVNMISEMAPVRDQGSIRGTCVAHAVTAIAEQYFLKRKNQTINLSRQFLYWDCKRTDGDREHEGTWVSVAMAALATDGCCLETDWPYNPNAVEGNESQDPPPEGAIRQATQFKIPGLQRLMPTSLTDIKTELAAGRCVAFTIPVFASWYQNKEVIRTGALNNPIPGEANVGAHAMCFIGYEDDANDVAHGGGCFILRNSWNGNWATQSIIGTTGYGTVPYSYINAYCVEAYSIES